MSAVLAWVAKVLPILLPILQAIADMLGDKEVITKENVQETVRNRVPQGSAMADKDRDLKMRLGL